MACSGACFPIDQRRSRRLLRFPRPGTRRRHHGGGIVRALSGERLPTLGGFGTFPGAPQNAPFCAMGALCGLRPAKLLFCAISPAGGFKGSRIAPPLVSRGRRSALLGASPPGGRPTACGRGMMYQSANKRPTPPAPAGAPPPLRSALLRSGRGLRESVGGWRPLFRFALGGFAIPPGAASERRARRPPCGLALRR